MSRATPGRSVKAVHFTVPAERAYDYLVDPVNRPQWQSSLRAVADIEGENDVVGQQWRDVTVPGLRPLMRLTAADRPRSWSEAGTWRGFSAVLTLDFADTPDGGCDVVATMQVDGQGLAALPARVIGPLAPSAVRSDLKRAARILGRSA